MGLGVAAFILLPLQLWIRQASAVSHGIFSDEAIMPIDSRTESSGIAVAAFCRNVVPDLEVAMLEYFERELLEDFQVTTSEGKGFQCACSPLEEPDIGLMLRCNTMYAEFVDEPPIAFEEAVVFKYPENTATTAENETDEPLLVPSEAYYRVHETGGMSPRSFGEIYTLSTTGEAFEIQSCEIRDGRCPQALCGVCRPGGTTTFRTDPSGTPGCSFTSCGSQNESVQLYSLLVTNRKSPLRLHSLDYLGWECPTTSLATPRMLSEDDVATKDTFCSANHLRVLSLEFAIQFTSEFPGRAIVEDGVDGPTSCACSSSSSLTFDVKCRLSWSQQNSSSEGKHEEHISFHQVQNAWLPRQFQWCQTSTTSPLSNFNPFCESYTMALPVPGSPPKLAKCDIHGCEAGFCEVCSDGRSVGHSCFSSFACADRQVGSLMYPLLQPVRLRVSATGCTKTPTATPTTAAPTVAPSSVPSRSAAPTGAPSLEPSVAPSLTPTVVPTTSGAPTATPSVTPSTTAPSTSAPTSPAPTTTAPSMIPSTVPSEEPTVRFVVHSTSPAPVSQANWPTVFTASAPSLSSSSAAAPAYMTRLCILPLLLLGISTLL